MYIIRSAEELARYLTTGIDQTLLTLLKSKVASLSGYEGHELGDLASFLIVQPGDTAENVEQCIGLPLERAEYTTQQNGWRELVLILSDDGYGWVVYLPPSWR